MQLGSFALDDVMYTRLYLALFVMGTKVQTRPWCVQNDQEQDSATSSVCRDHLPAPQPVQAWDVDGRDIKWDEHIREGTVAPSPQLS